MSSMRTSQEVDDVGDKKKPKQRKRSHDKMRLPEADKMKRPEHNKDADDEVSDG